ncbi:uncharacterized protein LOC142771827 [Rhipicephalus microplus]|uniref:uncharacterized protein LOC142771827 n=1 Tax=Rhipicephalus microplus TaxID=6941 RepID=UPI003F6D67F6
MCVMRYRQAADIRRFFAFDVPCAVPFAHVLTRWTAFLLAVHRRDQGQQKLLQVPCLRPPARRIIHLCQYEADCIRVVSAAMRPRTRPSCKDTSSNTRASAPSSATCAQLHFL